MPAAGNPPETSSAPAPAMPRVAVRPRRRGRGEPPRPRRPSPPRRPPRHHPPPRPASQRAPQWVRRPRHPLPPARDHAAAGDPAGPPRAPPPRSSGRAAYARLRLHPRSLPGCERRQRVGTEHNARAHAMPSHRVLAPCRHQAPPSPGCSPRPASHAVPRAPLRPRLLEGSPPGVCMRHRGAVTAPQSRTSLGRGRHEASVFPFNQ